MCAEKIPSPQESEIIRLALTGSSVIDWTRLYFSTEAEVQHFLKINEFDVTKQKDSERLISIHSEAVGYLQRELSLFHDLSHDFLKSGKILHFFLMAADFSKPDLQKQACSLLKTMSIINHIDGRELLYYCPISPRDLFSLVEDKIERSLSFLLRSPASPLLKYQGGRKAKESLITKLLSKRETIAAKINDRVRYRLVTRNREDIASVILHLFENILPFNYIIPGASKNHIVSDENALRTEEVKKESAYSGSEYKVCKFAVDIPIRMDNFLEKSGGSRYRESLGSIAYVLVEFQIVDEETEFQNNSGENSHESYKKRQKSGVMKRLAGE